jgi:hypothetical protein
MFADLQHQYGCRCTADSRQTDRAADLQLFEGQCYVPRVELGVDAWPDIDKPCLTSFYDAVDIRHCVMLRIARKRRSCSGTYGCRTMQVRSNSFPRE